MKLRTLLATILLCAIPALAQLAPPNAQGVSMGHVHLFVKDIPAQMHFWVDIMGGKAVHNEKLNMIEFPGVYIFNQTDTSRLPPPAPSSITSASS